MNTEELIAAQKKYFATGATLSVAGRINALKKLKETITLLRDEIHEALQKDLGKCDSEAFICETGMTMAELSFVIKHVRKWARPTSVTTPLAQFHARSYIAHNPYGSVLIMSPWNYPFMLAMEPLVGAIAAGNCCIVKPSAYAPATSAVIKKIIEKCFDKEYVAVVEGGREENKQLLDGTFDMIFFTGGVTVGKEVMRKAAEHLTPVVLELGGKSPCIVDKTANIKLAAKRIAFGKLLNAGQTCVAPDYILADEEIAEKLIAELKNQFDEMLQGSALGNESYVHMINEKHYRRVTGLIEQVRDKVAFGGKGDDSTYHIEPTVIRNASPEDGIMQEEIFGPVLPVITTSSVEEAFRFVESRPHPLAAYLFSEDKKTKQHYRNRLQFGGGCINDTVIHLATSHMGFGGVGQSGMGNYHGKRSFDTFSHEKSIVDKSTWMDLPVRYAPYSAFKDKLLQIFLR